MLLCFAFSDVSLASTCIRLDGGCLATSSVRILVVDDFEPWRQQICSMLQTRPELHVAAEVGDGLEAVQKAKELQPDLSCWSRIFIFGRVMPSDSTAEKMTTAKNRCHCS